MSTVKLRSLDTANISHGKRIVLTLACWRTSLLWHTEDGHLSRETCDDSTRHKNMTNWIWEGGGARCSRLSWHSFLSVLVQGNVSSDSQSDRCDERNAISFFDLVCHPESYSSHGRCVCQFILRNNDKFLIESRQTMTRSVGDHTWSPYNSVGLQTCSNWYQFSPYSPPCQRRFFHRPSPSTTLCSVSSPSP